MAALCIGKFSFRELFLSSPCLRAYFHGLTNKTSTSPSYLLFNNTFTDTNARNEVCKDLVLFEDFVSVEEETSLFDELEPYLKRMKYESSHWDDAIHGYRETEKLKWNESNTKILDRVRDLAFGKGTAPLRFVHVLDLQETGLIKPHVDSIKFCGSTIAGISLLTASVMRLRHAKDKEKVVDVLLKQRSLYIMKGVARYDYTHEILGNQESVYGENIIKKSRRISVICRNEPK